METVPASHVWLRNERARSFFARSCRVNMIEREEIASLLIVFFFSANLIKKEEKKCGITQVIYTEC